MTTNGESIPVSEPGELLPEGTTFLEAFGASLSDVDIDRLRGNLNQIDENERRAALLSRDVTIGQSVAQPIRQPGQLVAKGVLSDVFVNEKVQEEFEIGLSEIELAERAALDDADVVIGGVAEDLTDPRRTLSPRAQRMESQ
ncbi:MAG TPA: hypothetical protein VGF75_03730 [Candidatus Saccharimonadales bacterium]|jgi:hypothetical protein